jgi:hypothetical protein
MEEGKKTNEFIDSNPIPLTTIINIYQHPLRLKYVVSCPYPTICSDVRDELSY